RALVGFCPRDLEGEYHPGDTAAAVRLVGGGGGHVVADEHGARLDVVHLDHLGGHVEVHHVAAIVAVDVDHAFAAVNAPGDVGDLFDRGRLEHVTDGAAIQHALPHVAKEYGQVARAAARHQADFALNRGIGPYQRVDVVDKGELLGVGLVQPIEHVGDELFGVIQDLLHGWLLHTGDG